MSLKLAGWMWGAVLHDHLSTLTDCGYIEEFGEYQFSIEFYILYLINSVEELFSVYIYNIQNATYNILRYLIQTIMLIQHNGYIASL